MKLFIIMIMCIVLSSCGLNINTPYAKIEQNTDSQIFAYMDADVKVTDKGIKSDDTTLIIIGVKDNTGADLTSIFNTAMERIKEIFHERQQVYKAWVK